MLEIPKQEKIVERIKELFKDEMGKAVHQLMQGEAAEWMAKLFGDFPSDVL